MSCETLDVDWAAKLTIPEIKSVAMTYVLNTNAAASLPNAAAWFFAEGVWHGRSEMFARQKVFGPNIQISSINKSDPAMKKKLAEYRKIIREHRKGDVHVPEVNDAVEPDYARMNMAIMASYPETRQMMYAQLVLAWSAFESLAGDLWEAAINVRPDMLATRLNTTLTFDQIRRATSGAGCTPYNLSGKIGTAMALSEDFISLDKIRTKYKTIFKKSSAEINKILSHTSLDALSALRNVIVHNGAKADADYQEDRKKAYKRLVNTALGRTVHVDGRVVKRILSPVHKCGFDLINAVSLWLTRFAEK
jgi:hypothetical protein